MIIKSEKTIGFKSVMLASKTNILREFYLPLISRELIVSSHVICYITPIEVCHTFRGHLIKGGCHLWVM